MTKPTTERLRLALQSCVGCTHCGCDPDDADGTCYSCAACDGHYESIYCEAAGCHNRHTMDYWRGGTGAIQTVEYARVPSIRVKYGQRLCRSHALIQRRWCFG